MITGTHAQFADWNARQLPLDLGELGEHEIERARRRGDHQQRAGPDPLQAGQRRSGGAELAAAAAARVRLSRSPCPLTARRVACGQGERLQQRNRRGEMPVRPITAAARSTARSGPTDDRQRSQQLGSVQRHLTLGGDQLGEAEVHDPRAGATRPPSGWPCAGTGGRYPARAGARTSCPHLPEQFVGDISSPRRLLKRAAVTRSMVSIAEPSAASAIRSTCGTRTPARSAISPTSA